MSDDTTSDTTAIEPTSVQTGAEVAAATGDNLPATQDSAPARMSWGGAIAGIINFITLAARIMALSIAAAILKERLHLLKRRMHKDAERARRLSGHLGQAGAAQEFQGQAIEVSKSFDRVAEASGAVANAADQMEANAIAVKDAHQIEYGGIYEVTNALPYAQPKPGFNEVR
ncbi:conjugal transfer protein TraB [Streptomyces sp. NPDC058297]|uniref:conjugal transfer protein TraB n=1 Tax=Streptomyces sp. NPDC058297 TaxID=3346433 RepID=UPI0036E28639